MLRSITLAALCLFTLLWGMIFVTESGNVLASSPKASSIATGVNSAANIAAVTGSLITVTTTTDELNNDGDCALREAIQAAYTEASVDSCPAGSGGDTIYLPAGHYTLLLDQLHLTGTVTLSGSVTGASIVDGNFHRVFYIYPDAMVTLLHLQISNGRAPYDYCSSNCNNLLTWGGGGGIANYGTTTIAHSTLHGNRAGIGEQQAIDSFYGADGGGIFNKGIMTITSSTISDNTAGDGTYFPQGSSIPHICARPGEGGGIANFGTLTLENSTVTDNRPGERGYDLTICGPVQSTYLGKFGGIYNRTIFGQGQANFYIKNSIVTGNHSGDCGGPLISLGQNLIQNTYLCPIEGTFTQLWANLGPLQENGGPTLTHALNQNSPAIDTGICTDSGGITVTVDQRGEPRPQGEGCDIGAYESPYTSTFTFLDTTLPFVTR